jgi:hypothetical protein
LKEAADQIVRVLMNGFQSQGLSVEKMSEGYSERPEIYVQFNMPEALFIALNEEFKEIIS